MRALAPTAWRWRSQSEAMRRVSVSKYARLRTEFADREDRMKDETHKIKSVIPPTGSRAPPYAVAVREAG
jgi:hypothetical protein